MKLAHPIVEDLTINYVSAEFRAASNTRLKMVQYFITKFQLS